MAADTTVSSDTGKTSSQQCGASPDDAAEVGAVTADPAPTIHIDEKPAPGQLVVYEASSLEVIRISFDINGAMVKDADGHLSIYFQDGSVIVVNGATISQLCSSTDEAAASIDEPASVPDPVDAPLVDPSGSGFSELIVGPLGGTSLTLTGPLSDLEFDRVWFRPGDGSIGATHDFPGPPDDLRGNSPDPGGNPDNGSRPPIAAGDSLPASEDGTVTIPVATLLANDRDGDGDALTIVSVQDAVNGTVLLSGTNVIFNPAVDYHGQASFTYMVSDGRGGSATVRVDLTISSVNDPPQGADTTVATAEDTPLSLALADFGFSDPKDSPADSLLAVTITSLPTNGTLLLNGVATSAGQSIAVADIVAGALVFQPGPNASGAAYSSFTFQVQDSGGTANGGQDIDPSPNSVAIAVIPVNDPPLAQDDAFVTDEDTALSGSVLANDSDVEGPLAVSLASAPASGSLALDPDGSFTYTPDPDFNGADAFSYTVTDNAGASATATVTIDVTPVNDPPLAADDTWAVSAGSAMAVGTSALLANDSDPEGGPLTVTGVGNVGNGTVVLAGTTVTYTAGAAGAASLQYTVTDADGTSSTGIVSIYGEDKQNPEFIQVTVGYRDPRSALLTDAALNETIQAAQAQMKPEYGVMGNVERITGGVSIFFIITERKHR